LQQHAGQSIIAGIAPVVEAPMELDEMVAQALKHTVSVDECAEESGLSRDVIWKAVREGRLAKLDLGNGAVRIRRDTWRTWLASRCIAGMTAESVAEICGVTQIAVTRWATRGQLVGRKVLGRWVFDATDVAAFAKARGLDVDLDTHAA